MTLTAVFVASSKFLRENMASDSLITRLSAIIPLSNGTQVPVAVSHFANNAIKTNPLKQRGAVLFCGKWGLEKPWQQPNAEKEHVVSSQFITFTFSHFTLSHRLLSPHTRWAPPTHSLYTVSTQKRCLIHHSTPELLERSSQAQAKLERTASSLHLPSPPPSNITMRPRKSSYRALSKRMPSSSNIKRRGSPLVSLFACGVSSAAKKIATTPY